MHQLFVAPLINLHKEAWPIPLATLSKMSSRSQLNDPFQNPNIASSIYALLR